MINFNSLPSNKPVNLPETGTYIAVIENAEMKQGQDTTKPPYLNLLLSLQTADGKPAGKIYDIISESDKELVQYKLARFIKALGLEKLGVFELADLIKIIKTKKLIVDVKQEEAKNGYAAKSVVDVFKGEIYYPITDAKEVLGTEPVKTSNEILKSMQPIDDDSLAINASDAADVHAAEDDDF